MKLAYQAFDRAGRPVNDIIDAPDVNEASDRLRRQGLFVAFIAATPHDQKISRTESKAQGDANRLSARAHEAHALQPHRAPKRRLKNLTMFTRQLQVLVATGTPIVQSLAALERQAQDQSWRSVIADVRRRVEEGSTLADALESHPRCFDAIYRSLIAAGESGSSLDQMLSRLASLTRQQHRIRSSIIGTLTYPCLLMVVAAVVLGVMIGFILPRFAGLYETLDSPLPPSTQLLMSMSEIIRAYWWLMLGVLTPCGIAAKIWLGTPNGKRMLDTVFIRAPQFGRIVRSFATARLTRVLGVLIESHVPLLDALRLTRQSAGNTHYAELVGKAEEAVTRGETVSSAFATSALVNPYIVEAIRNGENSGQVGPLLISVADFLDEENEVVVKSLTSIIEPVILIVLGLLVGVIALSMFLPLFDMTAMAGGGGG
jgi:type II secretory pathway component PulF